MLSNLYNSLFTGTNNTVQQGQSGYYQQGQNGQFRRPRLLPQLPMRPLPMSPARYRRYHCKTKTLRELLVDIASSLFTDLHSLFLVPHYEPSIFRREFILDMLWELFQTNANLAFSPYSLQATMTALLAGLNSETRDQVVRVLYSHYLAREFYEPQALADKIVEQFAGMNHSVCLRNSAYMQLCTMVYSDERYSI